MKGEEISKELLEKLYVKEGKNQTQIGEILGVCQSDVSAILKKYRITKKNRKPARHNKYWSKEEVEKLEELLGTYNYKTIAKMIGKTPKAVAEKKKRLKLDTVIEATEFLNSNELGTLLGRSPCTIRKWIKNKGLPHSKKVLANEREFYRIDTKKLWEWIKENENLMRWDLYELGSIANEPKWVLEKKKNFKKTTAKRWNKTEDMYLEFYYKQGLSFNKIAEKLGRTMKSIDMRLIRLKIKRKTIQINWKDKEVKMLLDMKKEGKNFNFIANELGRTYDSVAKKYRSIERIDI
jgi:DNA-binding Lrp family transcriptional regulator